MKAYASKIWPSKKMPSPISSYLFSLSSIVSTFSSVFSCFISRRSSLWKSEPCFLMKFRIRVNARIIRIFTSMALSERRTLLSIATPFSVKAYGIYLEPPLPPFEVTICDLKHSSFVSWNIKSVGNRWILRLTAWFNTLVSTPYNFARSLSSMTCSSRIIYMRDSIFMDNNWLSFKPSCFWRLLDCCLSWYSLFSFVDSICKGT